MAIGFLGRRIWSTYDTKYNRVLAVSFVKNA